MTALIKGAYNMARDNVFMIIDKKGTGIGQMFHHNNKC